MSVSNSIKEYRKKMNLTQEELAVCIKVTRQTVIALEKGSYVPSLSLALDLAEFFKVSVEQLFQKDMGDK